MRLVWYVDNITAIPYTIPTLVHSMLCCGAAKAAFVTATAPYYTDNYAIPAPTLVVNGLRDGHLQGWVCMKGFIAINSRATINAGSSNAQLLALFNLLGHEMQHGILRAYTGNFNTHTPALARGRRTPKEKWFVACLVSWCAWLSRVTGSSRPHNV